MNGSFKRGSWGFTLVEILVAMAVIAILTAIAYPSYFNYITKSRRADGLGTLTQDQIIMERCYAQNFAYNTACAAMPSFPQTSPNGYYSIALTNLSATTYTLTATPLGTQVKDTTCATMSVNQANVKTASDSSAVASPKCWTP